MRNNLRSRFSVGAMCQLDHEFTPGENSVFISTIRFTMHGGSSDVVVVTFSQTSATLDASAKSHGSFVVNCDHGGGHCGAPAMLQVAAWQFLKDHPWGFGSSPWASALPAGVPAYCKIY